MGMASPMEANGGRERRRGNMREKQGGRGGTDVLSSESLSALKKTV